MCDSKSVKSQCQRLLGSQSALAALIGNEGQRDTVQDHGCLKGRWHMSLAEQTFCLTSKFAYFVSMAETQVLESKEAEVMPQLLTEESQSLDTCL